MTNPDSRSSNHPLSTLNSLSESSVDDATPLTEFDSGEPPKPPRRRPPTGGEFEPTDPEEPKQNSIKKILEYALKARYLTPAMEAEVRRICGSASELSIEEYMALDRLMGAILMGEVRY